MDTFLTALAEASFRGSIVIAAVVLLRILLRKAPKSLFCLLWLLAGLRLMLPFEIQSSLSRQPDYSPAPQAVVQPGIREEILSNHADMLVGSPNDADIPAQTPTLPDADRYDWEHTSYLYKVEDGTITGPLTFFDLTGPIWILGLGTMLTLSCISYFRLKRRVAEACRCADGCWECPGLDTAFVLGFGSPRIYLPAGLSGQDRKFIYDHENTHIARHDHISKLLGYLVLSVHWFNPLVWLGYHLLCRDIELACDEHVVKYMDLNQRKAYSNALLSCGSHTARFAACPVAFGESSPKQRILNVLRYKKPTVWIIVLALIAIVFVSVCLLTSPREHNPLDSLSRALEAYQSRGSWHIQAEYTYENRPGAKSCTMDIWEDGDCWYRVSSMELADGNRQTTGYVSKQDVQYTFFVSGVYHPELRRWSLAEEQQQWYPYWLPRFRLEESNITRISEEETETGTVITTILAEPTDAYTQLQIRWHLDDQGNLTHVERHEQLTTQEDGQTFLMGIHMDISLLSDTREEIHSQIENALEEIPENIRQEPVRNSEPQPSAGEEDWILKCREAMEDLKNSEELYLHIENLDNPNDVTNTYMRSGNIWLFQYQRPNWDYAPVSQLFYGEKEYLFSGERTDNGVLTTPYYWQTLADSDGALFHLPYPFDLDWQNISLEFRDYIEETDRKTIVLSFPDHLDLFAFTFDYQENLLWFDIDDSTGEPEATTSRVYVRYPRGGTIADELIAMGKTASAMADRLPESLNHQYYQKLFTREPDGNGTAMWICELFDVFYQDPEEFIAQLAVLNQTNPVQAGLVLVHMAEELTSHAPLIFEYTLYGISETHHPEILEQMKSMCAGYQSQKEDLKQQLNAAQQLAKCGAALENFKARGTWCLVENNFFSGSDVLNSSSDTTWYIQEGNYFCHTRIPEDGGCSDFITLCRDGQSYYRQGFTAAAPESGDGWESDWNAGFYDNTPIREPWPFWFEWSGADLTYLETSQDDYSENIQFWVRGDPTGLKGEAQQYIVTFCLNREGALRSIRLNYLLGDTVVEKVMVLRETTREEVEKLLEQHHREALSHTGHSEENHH